MFLYESFRVAICILVTTGLAIAAVLIGLWLTGTELKISSLMGMVMKSGKGLNPKLVQERLKAKLGGG